MLILQAISADSVSGLSPLRRMCNLCKQLSGKQSCFMNCWGWGEEGRGSHITGCQQLHTLLPGRTRQGGTNSSEEIFAAGNLANNGYTEPSDASHFANTMSQITQLP